MLSLPGRQWLRSAFRAVGPALLPSGADSAREALDLLTPWDAGLPLIRVGGEADGGYLLPEDLEGVAALLSPGVAETWDFEREMGEEFGIRSYMIDGSVDAPLGLTELQDFRRVWLGSRTRGDVVSLKNWVGDVEQVASGDLALQMDIEGAEYRVLSNTPVEVLQRFRMAVVEYHGLEWMRFAPAIQGVILPALRKMSVSFEVVHVHPNNCCGTFMLHGVQVPRVLEVTYLRRDRVRVLGKRATLPHPLDRNCLAEAEPINLGHNWPRSC